MRISLKTNQRWRHLIGQPGDFSIEQRMYHTVVLISIIALFFLIFINYFLGSFFYDGLHDIVLFLFGFFVFYLSRYRQKFQISFLLFVTSIIALFVLSYFVDSGVRGPNDIEVLLYLMLIICVTPTKQRFFWFFTIMAINLGLHGIEFYHPEWIKYQYRDRSSLILDFSFAFGIVASIIFVTINYLRRNYNIEKQFSEESARALTLQYQQITEQKLQLERSSSEKDKLMSIIAHDLRAPLGNIQNYLELIAEYDIGSDGRKIVEADLLKATQNTMAMLSKLLLWSKAQMDGVTVNLEKINLSETINAPLEIERSLASNKQINLLCYIDPAITLLADTDMLQLVLRNLVNNAIKFTPPGGTITVEASKTASACRINVTDTGIGIPYDQQSSLFSLRARSTYGTANEKGVGLGLLLCKEFTELQGGILGFNSTPGQGSTFFMEFALSE